MAGISGSSRPLGLGREHYCLLVLQDEWLSLASAHADRTRPWVEDRLARRSRGDKHAVYDFLFDYYPYSPAKLSTWHPGYGVVLEGPEAARQYTHDAYTQNSSGVTADIGWLKPREPRLKMAIRLLQGTLSRQPMTGCFALHEWAMVYGLGQDEIRHPYLPLRVSPETIRDTVDSVGLRCTHIDAYRFYTDEALPLNATVPTRERQPDDEQPGCLHAAMDCYKIAGWFSPLTSSDLVADAFKLAVMARELDMRSSPYDVSEYGMTAIEVNTSEGRKAYANEQQRVSDASAPVRLALLDALLNLESALSELSPS